MKRFAVLMFAGAILLLSGCASATRWVRSPVVDQQYCKVDLEHRIDQGVVIDQKYSHPYQMDTLAIETVLRGIAYHEKVGLIPKPKKTPVFQDKEVARLAPALADALATANLNQRIRFISQNKGGGLFFAARRQTQGVMFVKPEGFLNIAFNFINYELDSSQVSGVPSEIAGTEPLEIEKSETPLILELPYAKPHPSKSGGPSPMWLVVELDKLRKALEAAPEKETGVVSTPATGGPGEKPGQKQQVKNWEDQKKEMEEKLRFLKGLFDEGLINQEEYETQKSGILKELMEP